MSAAQPELGDLLVRTLSSDGGVTVRALVATELVREAAERHGTSPTASNALGRALVGTLLFASGQSEEETVQVQFRGNGPLGTVTVIADGGGRVRGFVHDPRAELPLRDGKLDVSGAIGEGIVTVVRNHPDWREPYSGIVTIQTGEVASDLAHYLAESEQKPSVVAIGVSHEEDGSVRAAGGFLAQALPDADDETVARVDTVARGLPPVTTLLDEGLCAPDLAELVLAGVGARELHAQPARFSCPCTRERVLEAVALLGGEELREAQRSGETIETHCRFCAERYLVGGDELGALAPDA